MSPADEEKQLTFLENQIPDMAAAAFATARMRTLAAGLKVLQTEDGVLYEISPDGAKKAVGKVPPPVPSGVGTIINLS